ncbi:hypothetical protein COO91_02034 [Nostoc flagelliforme CCNUN1]|uniref:Uncharacterized protein n=1 Tax=Nostoc flagelliforme CCNUN1 TaxID=2038116 RepID=A0A2K8SLF8_9NOSO|nr:hypothetical protein COO91_02034 [Nostoc flagelliforme CCNUN1]
MGEGAGLATTTGVVVAIGACAIFSEHPAKSKITAIVSFVFMIERFEVI